MHTLSMACLRSCAIAYNNEQEGLGKRLQIHPGNEAPGHFSAGPKGGWIRGSSPYTQVSLKNIMLLRPSVSGQGLYRESTPRAVSHPLQWLQLKAKHRLAVTGPVHHLLPDRPT